MSQPEAQRLEQLLAEAQAELAEAQAAMPAHSVRPWQMQRLEDAEERVAELKAQLAKLGPAGGSAA
jgi:DNA repair exonuclease SbcCD ATPase subunit